MLPLQVEQRQNQLTPALQEAAKSGNKRLYETDAGIRVLTPEEANITFKAHPIGLAQLSSLSRERIGTPSNKTYTAALQIFANALEIPLCLNADRLKHIAEVEGYGYKKANLDQTTELCKESFGPYNIKVPIYSGISSQAIQQLLQQNGLDLGACWQQIIKTHFSTAAAREEALRSKKFPEEFLTDCASLSNQITEIFTKLSNEPIDSLNKLFSANNLDDLLAKVREQKERLMVRSTGSKEDTKELANAGGNTSVPNVDTTIKDVLLSMGEVVSSYIGKKSLKQRLGAADPSLFDPIASTPVLLQRMIGEKDPQALPKCGVMFTEDSESTFRSEKTSGITHIQSAYGHNEAVVTGLIPVDSYHVNDKHDIIPVLKPKTYRMMPTEQSGQLQLVANDPSVVNDSSLSKDAIDTLKNFAERLEQFYGGPMDVEFVVDEKEKTVYIVQARPLVRQKEAVKPSYIADIKKIEGAEVLKGSTIIGAGGALLLVKTSQLIVAQSLSEANILYDECENKPAIEGVIIGRMSNATSHWSTVFREAKMPVIYMDQLQQVEGWLEDEDAHILLSPQQGLVAKIPSEMNLQELYESNAVVEGWIDYPAPPFISTSLQFQPDNKLTDEAIKALYPALTKVEKWHVFQAKAAKIPLQNLFDSIRDSKGEPLQIALATLLYQFKSALERYSKSLPLDATTKQRIDTLQRYALALAKDIIDKGDCEPHEESYCRKLLPIHFLHALVYSQQSSDEVVDGHSLKTVALKGLAQEQVMAQQLEKEGIQLKHPYSLSLLCLGQAAFTSDLAKLYRDRIVKLDAQGPPETLAALARMVVKMNKLDMLVSWLNISFVQNSDFSQHVMNFEEQLPFFEDITQKRETVNAINVAAFGQAKSFDTQWRVLKNQVLAPIKKAEFAAAYKQAGTSGKLAALALMNSVVNHFDLAIKELEGSSEYALEKKLELFQTMLKEYLDLAQTWEKTFKIVDDASMSTVFEATYKAVHKEKLTEEDLRFSHDFDVIAYTSISGYMKYWGYQGHPTTLEDGFSVIHQELLIMLNKLNKAAIPENLSLPSLIQKAQTQLMLGKKTGMEFNARGVSLYSTEPLRTHGMQYILASPPHADKITLTVQFSGPNLDHRWDRICHFMLYLKLMGKFDITDFELNRLSVGFALHLDDTDNLKNLNEVLILIKHATYNNLVKITSDDACKVENIDKQGLEVFGERKIVQQFERTCGAGSWTRSKIAQSMISKLVEVDPPFVLSLIKNTWRKDQGESEFIVEPASHSNFFLEILEHLIEGGTGLGDVYMQGINLIHQNHYLNIKQGVTLLQLIVRHNRNFLTDGCAQEIFTVLLRPRDLGSYDSLSFYRNLFYGFYPVFVNLLDRGIAREPIQNGIVSLLQSQSPLNQSDAIKIIKLLIEYKGKYAGDVKAELNTLIQQADIEAQIKQLALEALNA